MSEEVVNIDIILKSILKKLEETVTSQGTQTNVLTEDTRRAISEVAKQIMGEHPEAQKVREEMMSMLKELESRSGQSIRDMEERVGAINAERIHMQLAELGSSVTAMGEGIARRFEGVEGQVREQVQRLEAKIQGGQAGWPTHAAFGPSAPSPQFTVGQASAGAGASF